MRWIVVLLSFYSFTAQANSLSLDGSTFGMRYRNQANAGGVNSHNQLQFRVKLFTTVKTSEHFGFKAALMSSDSHETSWMNTGVDVDRNTKFENDFYLKRLNVFYKSKTEDFNYKFKFGSMSNKADYTVNGAYAINGDTYSNLALNIDFNHNKFFGSLLIGEARTTLHPDTFKRFQHTRLNFTRMSFKYVTTNQHQLGYDFMERSDYSAHRLSLKYFVSDSTSVTAEYLSALINSVPQKEGSFAIGAENKNSYGNFNLIYYDSKDYTRNNLQQTLFNEVGQNLVFIYKYNFKAGFELFVNLRHSLKDENGKHSSAQRSQIGINVPLS